MLPYVPYYITSCVYLFWTSALWCVYFWKKNIWNRLPFHTISIKSFSTKSLVQPLSKRLRRQALQWLAKLHSMFWGSAADEAVKHGCPDDWYWTDMAENTWYVQCVNISSNDRHTTCDHSLSSNMTMSKYFAYTQTFTRLPRHPVRFLTHVPCLGWAWHLVLAFGILRDGISNCDECHKMFCDTRPKALMPGFRSSNEEMKWIFVTLWMMTSKMYLFRF